WNSTPADGPATGLPAKDLDHMAPGGQSRTHLAGNHREPGRSVRAIRDPEQAHTRPSPINATSTLGPTRCQPFSDHASKNSYTPSGTSPGRSGPSAVRLTGRDEPGTLSAD